MKALDLDEELDDFDGGTESNYDDEIGAEDKGMCFLDISSTIDVL